MQPPVDSSPSMQDSVVGGNLHTGHVIHNHYHMPQQPPQQAPVASPPQYQQPQMAMHQPQSNVRHPSHYAVQGGSKDVLVAYLLWFFLGFLGVHRFYLNNIGLGIVYLFTFGGCGLFWLIDLFLIPDLVRRSNTIYVRN